MRRRMQMIFQDPYASLNPRMTVFDILAEPLRFHRNLKGRACMSEVVRLMEMVGLQVGFLRKYPHEFSGGQRQRIAIARALSVNPALIIADEPVSALDVSIQAQILNLLFCLRNSMDLSMLFISHDLAVVRHISDRIAVMFKGRIVETGPREALFLHAGHPYTRALLAAIPVADPDYKYPALPVCSTEGSQLVRDTVRGCPYSDRCPYVIDRCTIAVPPLEVWESAPGHCVACIRKHELWQ